MISAFKTFCVSIVDFNEEEWQAMEKCLKEKSLRKNEHFMQEGEVCSRMGFVVGGSTRLYFVVEGEDITKDFCFENSFTGSLASFLSRQPSHFNVVAMEDTQLLTFTYASQQELCSRYQCWNTLFRKLTEQFAVRKENREISFLLHRPEERYQELLKHHPLILQRVPLKLVAAYLGMTPETLSRIRKKTT